MTLKSIMLLIVFPSPHLIKIALIFLWIISNHTWIVASVLIKMICTCKKSLYFILYAGLLRQPKWGHLKDLHRAIKLCEPALVSGNPTVMPLGNYQEVKLTCAFLSLFISPFSRVNISPIFILIQAHVFKSKSACAAFLANYNQRTFAKVAFGNQHYNLPPWSISILPDCKNTVYNTARVRKDLNLIVSVFCLAKLTCLNFSPLGNMGTRCRHWKQLFVQVGHQSTQMKMTPVPIHGGFSWQAFNEVPSAYGDSSFTMSGLLEQINTTRDATDYLWYMTEWVPFSNYFFFVRSQLKFAYNFSFYN